MHGWCANSRCNAPCPPELAGGTASAAACDISGQTLPGISKWSLSDGAEGNVPAQVLGQAGEVYLGIEGSARPSFSSGASRSAYTNVAGYALTNFRLGFRTKSGFNLFGWVRNALGVHYFELLQVAPGSTGLIVGSLSDPRTFGGTVKVEF